MCTEDDIIIKAKNRIEDNDFMKLLNHCIMDITNCLSWRTKIIKDEHMGVNLTINGLKMGID